MSPSCGLVVGDNRGMNTVSVWLTAIDVLLVLISAVCGAFAWWYANKSRQARDAAEASERRAKELVAGVQKTADQTERIAASLEGPRLVMEHYSGFRYLLRNKGEDVVRLVRLADGYRAGVRPIEFPLVILPGRSVELRLSGAMGYEVPSELVFVDDSGCESAVVVPPKPAKTTQ